MGWGNRKDEDLPESLKGKTPEQIAFELEEAKKLKERLDKQEAKDAERDTMFQSFATSQQTLVDTLKAVNERVPAVVKPVVNNDQHEPASFITDPDLAFNERVGPLAAITMQTAAITAKQEAQRAFFRKQATEKNNIDGTLFERFESEILEMAKNCTPAQLANPMTWAHLYFNVKGRHADEIVANPKSFFTEDAKRSPTDGGGNNEEQPTDQEKSIASKMGVPIENYMKHKKSSTAMPF
jgi:malonyl CoA-acyl carrier protein transacylase